MILQKILSKFYKWFCQKNWEKFKKMILKKNFLEIFKIWKIILATKFFEKSHDVSTLSKWDWHKDFFVHVYALQYLTNIEEQPKSFIVHQ